MNFRNRSSRRLSLVNCHMLLTRLMVLLILPDFELVVAVDRRGFVVLALNVIGERGHLLMVV